MKKKAFFVQDYEKLGMKKEVQSFEDGGTMNGGILMPN